MLSWNMRRAVPSKFRDSLFQRGVAETRNNYINATHFILLCPSPGFTIYPLIFSLNGNIDSNYIYRFGGLLNFKKKEEFLKTIVFFLDDS